MSFLIAAPEPVAAAATDLARVGSTLGAANAAAVAPTSSVIAAGADEVSASIAVQQDVLHTINAPSQALTGRPLIGNGANGAPGTGANGGDGGWLIGNGGNGAFCRGRRQRPVATNGNRCQPRRARREVQ